MHNSVINGLASLRNHEQPMTNISVSFDLNSISTVPPEYSAFFESVVSVNNSLIQGDRKIINEF